MHKYLCCLFHSDKEVFNLNWIYLHYLHMYYNSMLYICMMLDVKAGFQLIFIMLEFCCIFVLHNPLNHISEK